VFWLAHRGEGTEEVLVVYCGDQKGHVAGDWLGSEYGEETDESNHAPVPFHFGWADVVTFWLWTRSMQQGS
jgi:hypothetical protein